MPQLTGKPAETDGSEQLAKLNAALDLFDKNYLKNTKFIFSDEISIADIMAVTELSQLEV